MRVLRGAGTEHAGGSGNRVKEEPVVQLVDATAEFATEQGGRLRALDSVSIQIVPGRVTCLVGPSGCGKTTVLNVIAGFVRLRKGTLRFHASQGSLRLGYVFQEYALFPWMTVRENLVFGLRRLGRPQAREREHELVNQWLGIARLEGFEGYFPHQLSGGMKQRVSLARALIYEPDLVLMDEPFGALDELTRQKLIRFMDELLAQHPFTAIYVTHNLREAAVLADTIYVMASRPGRVVQTVTVDVPRPRGLYGEEAVRLEGTLYELIASQERVEEKLASESIEQEV